MDVTVGAGKVSSGRLMLDANQVSTVTFVDNIGRVQVWTDGTREVYVTVNGAAPTVDGQHCYEIPVGAIGEYDTTNLNGSDVVKLISAGTPVVRVEAA